MGIVLDDNELHSCRASPRFWTLLISLRQETYLLRGQEVGAPFSRAFGVLSLPPPPPAAPFTCPDAQVFPWTYGKGPWWAFSSALDEGQLPYPGPRKWC